jgi:hypothetical protein
MSEMASHGGTIQAAFLCWLPLVAVVAGLAVAFYFTNMKAFSRMMGDGTKKHTGGAFDAGYKGWRWK